MKTVIEDTWFPAATRIRIERGGDVLLFRRCSFDGGEIHVEDGIAETIFAECVFRGTRFSGQPLSERIAVGCEGCTATLEHASGTGTVPPRHFRR